MPLTRYERGVIEDLLNRVIEQQAILIDFQAEITRLNTAIENISGNNLLQLSTEEQASAIEEAVKKIIKKLNIKMHNHLSDQEGGPAFAKKGATLIE